MSLDITIINFRFKEKNLKWKNIQVVITDTNKNGIHIVEQELPNAQKLICFMHVLQQFRKEITPKNLNITNEEVLQSLEYINRLAYSITESDYDSTFEKMKNYVPDRVVTYYSNNWHHNRQKWVKCFTNSVMLTNNHLETLNSKLKSVYSTQSTFVDFIDYLFTVLNVKEFELRNQYSRMILKGPKEIGLENKVFYEYLTPFAYKKIINNLKTVQESENNEYTFKKEGRYTFCITKDKRFKVKIYENQCECHFFKYMKLPCKHLLVFRKFRGLDLFNPHIFGKRWSRRHIQRLFENSKTDNLTTVIREDIENDDETSTEPSIEKTQNENLKQAQTVCLKLAKLCSEVSIDEFNKRIDLLVELKSSWENYENATLCTENMESICVEYLEDEFNDDNGPNLDIGSSDLDNDHDYFVAQSDATNIYRLVFIDKY